LPIAMPQLYDSAIPRKVRRTPRRALSPQAARRPDDFPQKVKQTLYERVQGHCSRPGCLVVTSGPHSDPSGVVNVGVAAHITGASAGGPRYDPKLTPERRRSAENGVWLCQNDGKAVDNDTFRWTADELRLWKAAAEKRADDRRAGQGEDAEKRQRWLNQFTTTAVVLGGESWNLVWDGPLPELRALPTRSVSPAEMEAVMLALCRFDAGQRVQPLWTVARHVKDPKTVWLVDREWTTKQQLRGPDPHEAAELTVFARQERYCLAYCPECGRLVSSGVNCSRCMTRLQRPVTLKHPT
jgi:hypothetical protein